MSEGNETGEIQTGLKTLWVQKQKDTAATLLLLTDWYVTRKAETGQLVPDEITATRSAIRAAVNNVRLKSRTAQRRMNLLR